LKGIHNRIFDHVIQSLSYQHLQLNQLYEVVLTLDLAETVMLRFYFIDKPLL